MSLIKSLLSNLLVRILKRNILIITLKLLRANANILNFSSILGPGTLDNYKDSITENKTIEVKKRPKIVITYI